MAVGGVGSISAFQVQATPQAKAAEEQAEPAAVKAREAESDKATSVSSTARPDKIVDIKV